MHLHSCLVLCGVHNIFHTQSISKPNKRILLHYKPAKIHICLPTSPQEAYRSSSSSWSNVYFNTRWSRTYRNWMRSNNKNSYFCCNKKSSCFLPFTCEWGQIHLQRLCFLNIRWWTKSKRLEILSTPKYSPQDLYWKYKSMGKGMYI